MGRRVAGLILMAVGVLCGILFTLLNLGGVNDTRIDKLMMYAGIITIALGLVVFATTSSPIKKEGKR
ncbi:MAG TPA: hypothetical protein VEV81_09555 [Pyrinomonadaceae bacterium]|nr:hypothetical protein [Pyrinomonadaceae bacterium]